MAKAVASANPQSIIAPVVDTFSREQASPEVIDELGKMMFGQRMSDDEVRQISQSSPIKRISGAEYDRIVAPYVQSATAPATMGGMQ